jgi:hypothetical protein
MTQTYSFPVKAEEALMRWASWYCGSRRADLPGLAIIRLGQQGHQPSGRHIGAVR